MIQNNVEGKIFTDCFIKHPRKEQGCFGMITRVVVPILLLLVFPDLSS